VLSATMSPASTTTAKPSAPSPATTPLSATLEATDPSERAVCKSVHRTPGLHQRTMEARFRAGPVMYTSTKHEVQEAVQLQMPQPDQHGPSYKDENVFISDTDSDSPPPLGATGLHSLRPTRFRILISQPTCRYAQPTRHMSSMWHCHAQRQLIESRMTHNIILKGGRR
jgi:hypothetical protein